MIMKNYLKGIKKLSIIACVLILIFTAGCQKQMTLQDYLNLGDKYLTETNYEKAIVAFTKAIELEPKAMKAYEDLANAYIKTEKYDKAKETLEQGISVYESLSAEEQTDEFKQIYEALLILQEEIKGYLDSDDRSDAGNENTVPGETGTVDAEQDRLVAEAKEKYGDILDQIVTALDRGTLELTAYYTEDFTDFVNGLEEPLYWQIEDGRYLGLYTAEDVYIYLGEMENGFRAGSGFWYREYHWESGYGATLYTGNWSDDYPNGSGTVEDVYTDEDGDENRLKVEGNFLNGYENGTMRRYVNDHYRDNNVKGNYSGIYEYEITHGVPDHLTSNEYGEVVEMRIIQESPSDMGPVYRYRNNNPWGVYGAKKE